MRHSLCRLTVSLAIVFVCGSECSAQAASVEALLENLQLRKTIEDPWIPYFYQQMDQTYKVNCGWAERLLGLPKLKQLPSEYLREHAHWGVFDDPIGVQLRDRAGVDKIMWSTDFPHIVTRWPKSWELVEEQFAGVPEDEKKAMLAGNAVKFFHLDAG
jgi:predicted TIM-barrel fold metal-dependent hydrolase